jgi:phage terminase large subunit
LTSTSRNTGSIEEAASVIVAKGWRRGDDWVPHDARARDIGTGRTRVETMIRAGLKPKLVPDHKVDDGINAARQTIARCHFNAELCSDGIEALKAYRREWDEKLRTFKDTAVHDWASIPPTRSAT